MTACHQSCLATLRHACVCVSGGGGGGGGGVGVCGLGGCRHPEVQRSSNGVATLRGAWGVGVRVGMRWSRIGRTGGVGRGNKVGVGGGAGVVGLRRGPETGSSKGQFRGALCLSRRLQYASRGACAAQYTSRGDRKPGVSRAPFHCRPPSALSPALEHVAARRQ